tara:strand:- start:438 stop:578 length:141 start_codon:yes stop_codon:yes gene_type:complete
MSKPENPRPSEVYQREPVYGFDLDYDPMPADVVDEGPERPNEEREE